MNTQGLEPITLFLVGGNYPVIKDAKGAVVCDVPWQKDREATIALGYKLMDEYEKTGEIPLGPAPLKVRTRFAGYKFVRQVNGEYIMEDIKGDRSVWFANKDHANPGLIFRNTHLEFARSL